MCVEKISRPFTYEGSNLDVRKSIGKKLSKEGV